MHQGDLFFEWQEFALAALSFTLCAAIFLLRSRFPRLSGRAIDLLAKQSMHTRLTPRVGGIAIFAGLGVSVILAPITISGPYANFMFATSLLFVVGLAEDLGFHMSPRRRMLAAI
ncbi:MAG: hypothetical protein P8O10_11225, partial [Pseudorhodobacter sp.]|nr:hypothetical protein [Pseudorhodobacter sp.]